MTEQKIVHFIKQELMLCIEECIETGKPGNLFLELDDDKVVSIDISMKEPVND